MTYRPTTLTLADECCPRALDYWEEGRAYERDVFETGTAAHHVLQAVGESTNKADAILSFDQMKEVGLKVVGVLVSKGREFDGEPEPALHPERAVAGMELALDWLAMNPLEPGALYEPGLGVTDRWIPTAYSVDEDEVGETVWCSVCPRAKKPIGRDSASNDDCSHECEGYGLDPQPSDLWPGERRGDYGFPIPPWLKTALDYLRIEENEAGETVLTVRDYKSSWAVDADRLTHTQQKVQVLIALAHFSEVDVIRQEVVNIRSRITYTAEHYLAFPETDEMLADWRREVETVIAALEVKPRIANPGARCLGCPYLGSCEDAQEWLETVTGSASKEDLATAFAVADAERLRLRDLLKAACGEEPVELPDAIVGYQRVGTQVLKAGAYRELLQEWVGMSDTFATESGWQSVAGLLHAADLSKTSAEKVLKVLMPDRKDAKDRRELLESMCEPSANRVFKVERK